jgi:methylenetetrahydrofolate dehydrogenase (NADP+) / methenyltetrahydrofolate cyclohydrolase
LLWYGYSYMATIIDGAAIAQTIREELKARVAQLADKPGLAIILVGEDAGSHMYVNLKEKAAEEAGIHFEKDYYPATISQDIILNKIAELNERSDIHGILVQFPLPPGFDENKIVAAIDPVKDADGFHPENVRLLSENKPQLIPGLALGIIRLIESTNTVLSEKKVTILANSDIFANPLMQLLQQNGATAVFVTPDSADFRQQMQQADIAVVAIGKPRFVTADMIKDEAIIIDVGYNRVNNKAIGDVDFGSVSQKAGWITPVPGGVGPMTVAMLLSNVLCAYEIQK